MTNIGQRRFAKKCQSARKHSRQKTIGSKRPRFSSTNTSESATTESRALAADQPQGSDSVDQSTQDTTEGREEHPTSDSTYSTATLSASSAIETSGDLPTSTEPSSSDDTDETTSSDWMPTTDPESTPSTSCDALRRFSPDAQISTRSYAGNAMREAERKKIREDVEAYLGAGGTITQVPLGHQTEHMANFTRKQLIDHHKQRTRKRRGQK